MKFFADQTIPNPIVEGERIGGDERKPGHHVPPLPPTTQQTIWEAVDWWRHLGFIAWLVGFFSLAAYEVYALKNGWPDNGAAQGLLVIGVVPVGVLALASIIVGIYGLMWTFVPGFLALVITAFSSAIWNFDSMKALEVSGTILGIGFFGGFIGIFVGQYCGHF